MGGRTTCFANFIQQAADFTTRTFPTHYPMLCYVSSLWADQRIQPCRHMAEASVKQDLNIPRYKIIVQAWINGWFTLDSCFSRVTLGPESRDFFVVPVFPVPFSLPGMTVALCTWWPYHGNHGRPARWLLENRHRRWGPHHFAVYCTESIWYLWCYTSRYASILIYTIYMVLERKRYLHS